MSNDDLERLAPVDNAWLRMDRPYNHMTISAVFILGRRLTLNELQHHIETRWVTAHSHFRQRPVDHRTGAYWETDPHFDIDQHVHRIGLPGAKGKQELEEAVGVLVSTPLDPTKPLWDWHLVEDYQGGSAAIMRIHHCYADGLAMMHVLRAITDTGVDGAAVLSPPLARQSASAGDEQETAVDIFRQMLEPVSKTVSQAVQTGKDMMEGGVNIALHPAVLGDYARLGLERVSQYARQSLGFSAEATRLALLADDPVTCLRGPLGTTKQVAWAEPLSLDNVIVVSKVLGCTVNDVLLAAVTGALRAYLAARGEPVDRELTIRAAVPVNLRPQDQAHQLGNKFGLVLLDLPIGVSDPLERLQEVHRGMEQLKESYQALLGFGLLEILGLGPNTAQAAAIRILSRKATAVMTNVSGPQTPLYFAGCPIDELMFWVPQSGSVGMGVSILTYNHRVHFGLITDRKRVKDPEAIISRFNGEFERLLLTALMGPWPESMNLAA